MKARQASKLIKDELIRRSLRFTKVRGYTRKKFKDPTLSSQVYVEIKGWVENPAEGALAALANKNDFIMVFDTYQGGKR